MKVAPTRTVLNVDDPLARFSAAQKAKLAIEILGTYFRARWLLYKRSLPDVVTAIRESAVASSIKGAAPTVDGGRRYGWAVIRTLRVLPADSRCLVRSLVLLSVLARRGSSTTLVIGVRSEPEFGAHAWIEKEGLPLLDPGNAGDGRLLEL